MVMKQNYDKKMLEMAHKVFHVMEKRVAAEDLNRICEAFEFARKAHDGQKRKSGEPYIIHPVCVALILADFS